MKAHLALEWIGYDLDTQLARTDRFLARLSGANDGREIKGLSKRPWVAEITGPSERFGFERRFVEGMIDFKNANSKGSRGVELHFVLESGRIYEVRHHGSWKTESRYFCVITEDGDIEEVEEAWAKDRLTSTS